MNATQITVRVDADTMTNITGMSMDELEREEINIDAALTRELGREFPDADANGVSFYVGSVEVEAYDADGNRISVSTDAVMPAIERALKSI